MMRRPAPPVRAGDLDTRIIIQREEGGAFAQGSWATHAEVHASVRDTLPSRDERLENGLAVGSRRTRIRMWFRADLTNKMRVIIGDRVMRIVGGPSMLGRRQGTEILVEDWP